jgi:filamentous hemagglutinin family protein
MTCLKKHIRTTRVKETRGSSTVFPSAFHSFLGRYGRCAVWAVMLVFLAVMPSADASEGFTQVTDGNKTVFNQTAQEVYNEVDSYNIGEGEIHIYNQPSANAVFLQQVIGSDPSEILGRLSANGQVWILNPSGVLFGQGAVINTAGFVAAAMSMDREDYFSGNYVMNGVGGYVVNNGSINVQSGGYAILGGAAVGNNGLIVADQGEIIMAAGGRMTFDFSGDGLIHFGVDEQAAERIMGQDGGQMSAAVHNSGELVASKVLMTAGAAMDIFDAVVNNEGIIEAQSVAGGGEIRLLGEGEGSVVNSGELYAGGNGSSIEIMSADGIVVSGVVVIENDGQVFIIADQDNNGSGNLVAGLDNPAVIQTESGLLSLEGNDVIFDEVDIVTTDGGDVKITAHGGYIDSAATSYSVTGSISIDPPDPIDIYGVDQGASNQWDDDSDASYNVNLGTLKWADDVMIESDADGLYGAYPIYGDIVIGAPDPARPLPPLPGPDAMAEVRGNDFVELDANNGNIFATEDGLVTSGGNAVFSANQVIGTLPTQVDVYHLDPGAAPVPNTDRSRVEADVDVGAVTVDINGNLVLNALGEVQGISGVLQGEAGSLEINPDTPGMIIWNGFYIDHQGPLAVAYAQAIATSSPYEVNEQGGVEDLRLGSEYYGGGVPYEGFVMDNRAKSDTLNDAVFVPYPELITDERLMKSCEDEDE